MVLFPAWVLVLAKPTSHDAELLLKLEQLRRTESVDKAFAWFMKEIAGKRITSYEEYAKYVPEASEAEANIQR